MNDINSTSPKKTESPDKSAIRSDNVEMHAKKLEVSLGSLEEFLINVLKNPAKKINAKDALISKLAKNPKLSEEAIKELMPLEKCKDFFTVFRNLLRFSDAIIGFPVLKESLRGYLKESLCRNEVVVRLGLQGSILNIDNSLPLDLCFKKILSLSQSDVVEEYFKKIKPKDWKNYLSTMALVMAEWYANTRCMTPSQQVDLLNNCLWSGALKDNDPGALIKNLLHSTNFELMASATAFYQQKSLDATNRLLKAESQLADANAAKQALESELHAQEVFIAKLQSDLVHLNASHMEVISNSQLENQALSINLKNQLEDLRVRNLQLLKSSVELLADGLTAIGRPEPKINVMKDHAKRVYDSLNTELERLKG